MDWKREREEERFSAKERVDDSERPKLIYRGKLEARKEFWESKILRKRKRKREGSIESLWEKTRNLGRTRVI